MDVISDIIRNIWDFANFVDFRFLQLRLTGKTSVVLLDSKEKNNLLLKLYPISQHDIRIVRLLIYNCIKK